MDDLERTLKEFRHLIKERNDLSRRIKKAERSLESMADPTRTIKVSRGKHNGSALGTETVEGWTVDAARLQRSVRRYKALLARTHADITDMILEAERCVEAIDSSEVRTILRLRYINFGNLIKKPRIPWYVRLEMVRWYTISSRIVP